jgi:hypothetical protein
MSRPPALRLVIRLEPLDKEGPNQYFNRLAVANQCFVRDRLVASCRYGVSLLSADVASEDPVRGARLAAIGSHYANGHSRSWIKVCVRKSAYCVS